MKKYFVVSDCHSFFTLMYNALLEKGFDKNNPEHILISCGDMFDRGDESLEMLDFLIDLLYQKRLIAVKGNHDDLFQQMLTRKYFSMVDDSNGTIKTLGQLQQPEPEKIIFESPNYFISYDHRINELYNLMVDFYETPNHIFVHGWIPSDNGLYDPEWRNAKKYRWEDARWKNGMSEWKAKIIEPNKTIVCGHWHCSWGWSHIRQERKEFPNKSIKDWQKSFEPFVDDGIIAIDACTAYSNIVNVIVLNEDEI